MLRQAHSDTREVIVANAIQEVVTELRMVDIADYVAFIRMERFANLADIVESAAEMYFMPGTLRLGHGAEVQVGWSEPPRVELDLELKPQGAQVRLTLGLADKHASVHVNYVSFETPSPMPEVNTAFLEASLAHSRIRKTKPSRAA